MSRRILGSFLVLALVAGACSSEAAPTATTTQPVATTTTTPPPTTTTQPPTSTTSTIPYAALDVTVAADDEVSAAVSAFYSWFGDRTLPVPNIPQGLVDHLEGRYARTGSAAFSGQLHSAEVADMGTAGVVIVNSDDVILVVDEDEAEGETDTGWRVVGAWLKQYDIEPWFGNPERFVFVIGTDARPGEFQKHLRGDSLHIVASNIAQRAGGILGIPRDLRVDSSVGIDKFTNINALVFTETCGKLFATDEECAERDAGQDEMVQIASEFSGLPLEGWIVTGFLGFSQLVDAFGGVEVDIPVSMAEPNAEAYFKAGVQRIFGSDALALSRNRKQFGEIGDFVRSLHQGMIMLAALDDILARDFTTVPDLLATLMTFTWTSLSLEDLLTMATGALVLDPARIGNEVAPSTGGIQGGVYYANFTGDADALFRDLDDGSLTPGESWLTPRYTGSN